jgi:hypothetical protein
VVEALLIVYLFYMGSELILYRHKKALSVERLSRACLVQIAGPCPAEPFQLVPAQLGLAPAGSYQLWCTSHRNAACTQQQGAPREGVSPRPR